MEKNQLPEETADDYEASIKDKSDPYDRFDIKCNFCNKKMLLRRNIHTLALIFQFYKCSCPFTNTQIIVRDKRMNEYLVDQSKGMDHLNAEDIREKISRAILKVSLIYYCVRRTAGESAVLDARLDLVVDELVLPSYLSKISDDNSGVRNRKSAPNAVANMQQLINNRDIMGMKHGLRHNESSAGHYSFIEWLERLQSDSSSSIVRAIMSYMSDVYVHQIADDELDDYRRLFDMIPCMSVR